MSNLLDPKELQRVIKWAIYMYKTLSGCLEELKNKGKVQLGNPKSGPGHLQELFTTMFKSQFKHGFTKVVVTRAGHKESLDCIL